MAEFRHLRDYLWTPSPYTEGETKWERSGLYNDRPRKNFEEYTTIVKNTGNGRASLPPFPFRWEIFLHSGDLCVDGAVMEPGDHCVIGVGEKVTVTTDHGCVYLVIARHA